MTDYMIDKDEYGRTFRQVDVQAFTRDLTKALGGKVGKQPYDDSPYTRERYAQFELDGNAISVSTGWRRNERDKVAISIAPLASEAPLGYPPVGGEYKLPSINVAVSRPMERIVADVKRRLIEAAKAPLAKRREYAEGKARAASNLQLAAASLRVRHPGLSVTVQDGETYSGSIYCNGDGTPYLSGRFYSDGTVSVDRLGTLSADQFERVMAALYND